MSHLTKWWDTEINQLTDQLNALQRRLRLSNTDFQKKLYLETWKNWKQMKASKKLKYNTTMLQKLAKSPNSVTFWNIIKQVNKTDRPVDPPIQGADWIVFFVGLNEVNVATEAIWEGVGTFDTIVDSKLSSFELDRVLQNLRKQTATGPDLIPSFLLKNKSKEWRQLLLKILNRIVSLQKIPESWTRTRICPIHKDGPVEQPGNYSPIAVINILTKVLTAMLTNRLQLWAETDQIIPEEQNAFRRKRSTIEHIFVLRTLVDISIAKKVKLYAAFVDLRKAYDSVDHNLLWIKLQHQGLSPRFINVIRMVYERMCLVKIGVHKVIPPIKIGKGVLQGDPMSAVLFNLFLSDFEDKMKQSRVPKIMLYHTKRELNYLQFADDIVLLAENRLYMQKLLGVAQEYFNENKLVINEEKTKIIIFKKGGNISKKEAGVFYIDGKNVTVVKEYKYLGIKFHATGRFAKTTREMVVKA